MSVNKAKTIDLIALALLGLVVLAWDASGFDVPWALWYGNAQGFALRHNTLLQFWFHDVAQNLARVLFFICVLMIFFPVAFFKQLSKTDRVHLVCSTLLASLLVVYVKHLSKTSCPWSLDLFGGTVPYVGHWQLGVFDGGGGRCFPGGHSSSGFAFVAAAYWLRSVSPRLELIVFALASGMGLLLGWVQQMRGAHFFSHTLWAWLICWGLAALYYYSVQAIKAKRAKNTTETPRANY